jgi:hypothetical protein
MPSEDLAPTEAGGNGAGRKARRRRPFTKRNLEAALAGMGPAALAMGRDALLAALAQRVALDLRDHHRVRYAEWVCGGVLRDAA